MNRVTIFAFRVSLQEREMIRELAERLERSQSDAVRYVLSNAIHTLENLDKASTQSKSWDIRNGG